jgi:hypothetical protein
MLSFFTQQLVSDTSDFVFGGILNHIRRIDDRKFVAALRFQDQLLREARSGTVTRITRYVETMART